MSRFDLDIQGKDWPNRAASRMVRAGGLRWHVQIMGRGPVALVLHGTGASTHSYAELIPLLARDFTVVAPDLPGHGFTEAPSQSHLSLPGMARGVAALLKELALEPAIAVGHSAGAAILLGMNAHGGLHAPQIVSLNGAIRPLGGLAGQIFAPMARMLVLLPMTPGLFAWRAKDRRVVEELLSRTGSAVPSESMDRYVELFRNPAHVGGALGMMANWDLDALWADLPRVKAETTLVVGAADGMVPPEDAARVAERIAHARIVRLRHLGHLLHEEKPALAADLIRQIAAGGPIHLAPELGRVEEQGGRHDRRHSGRGHAPIKETHG